MHKFFVEYVPIRSLKKNTKKNIEDQQIAPLRSGIIKNQDDFYSNYNIFHVKGSLRFTWKTLQENIE